MDVATARNERCISDIASRGLVPSRTVSVDVEHLLLVCDRRPSRHTSLEKSRLIVVQLCRGRLGISLDLRADEWLRVTADPPIPCVSNEPPLPVIVRPGRRRKVPARLPWYDVHVFDSAEVSDVRIVSVAFYQPVGQADADVDDVVELHLTHRELHLLGDAIAEVLDVDRESWLFRARAEERDRVKGLRREAERLDHLLDDLLPFPPLAPELPLEERPRGSTQTVLYHRHGHYMGNLLWEPPFDPVYEGPLRRSIDLLKERGYWVSRFPVGDGLAFDREDYDPATVLDDFRTCFTWMSISEVVRTRTCEDR